MKLKEIAKVQGGYAFKSDSFVSNETPIIRIGNIVNNKVIIDNDITAPISTIGDRKEFLIFKDDLLIAMSGATVGKVGIYSFDNPSMLNQRVGNIKCDEKYKKYVFYLLQSPQFKKYVELSSIGCAQPNISNSQIENFEFKENSIGEIENIVRKLDNVSSLINIKKNEIEKLNILVKSQFVEMFGSKQDGFKYDKVKFNNCTESMLKGPFGSDIKKSLYVPKTADTYKVYIQINAIKKDESLGNYYISKKYFDEKMYKFEVKPLDYIVTCDGTLGKLLRLDSKMEKGIISASLLKITLNNKINYKYFEEIWNQYMLNELSRDIRNACLTHLPSAKVIESMEIPLPPLELQNKFAKFVEQVDKQKFNKVLNSLKYTEYMLKYKC